MMRKTVLIIATLCLSLHLMEAQQDPLFTQYAFNQVALNPGVAGTHDGTTFTAMSRMQWSGFAGAPETHIFTGHTKIGNNMGAGISFYNDQIGVSDQNEIGLMYAYHLRFDNSTLSFGARGVFHSFKADYTEVNLGGISDPRFAGTEFNDIRVNFGAGLYWYSDRHYLGVSMPYLTINEFTADNSDITFTKERSLYLLAGYVFDLGASDFKIKPYVNLRVPSGAPVQVDLNASLIYKEQVYLGFGVRPGSSLSAMFEWQIQNFRFGYAADFLHNDSDIFGRGANEFLLSYTLPTKGKAPRIRFF